MNEVQELERQLDEAKRKANEKSMDDVEALYLEVQRLLQDKYILYGNTSTYGTILVGKVGNVTVTKDVTNLTVSLNAIWEEKYQLDTVSQAGFALRSEKSGVRLGPSQVVFYSDDRAVVAPVRAMQPGTNMTLFGCTFTVNHTYNSLYSLKNQVKNYLRDVCIVKQEVYEGIKKIADRHAAENLELWEGIKKIKNRAVDLKDEIQTLMRTL